MKTKFFNLLILCSSLFFVAQCQNQATAPNLNGKTFQITITDPSNVSNTEQLVFTNNTFEGIDCRKYGFGSAPCTLRNEGTGTAFESATHSENEGDMYWKGVVTGNTVEGSVVWKKQGQADITYTFKGTAM